MSQRKTSVTQSFFTCEYIRKNVIKNFPNFITVPLTNTKKTVQRTLHNRLHTEQKKYTFRFLNYSFFFFLNVFGGH